MEIVAKKNAKQIKKNDEIVIGLHCKQLGRMN